LASKNTGHIAPSGKTPFIPLNGEPMYSVIKRVEISVAHIARRGHGFIGQGGSLEPLPGYGNTFFTIQENTHQPGGNKREKSRG
jgi:hypothetical protein